MIIDRVIRNFTNGDGSGTSLEWLANALAWESEDVPNCETTVPLPQKLTSISLAPVTKDAGSHEDAGRDAGFSSEALVAIGR